MLDFYKKKLLNKGEIYIFLKIYPGSSENKIREIKRENIEGKDLDVFYVSISAPADKNKANKELSKFLASEFQINKENVIILSGKKDRFKLIKIIK
jgi:uncharacterized protein (TIGR00251 family)